MNERVFRHIRRGSGKFTMLIICCLFSIDLCAQVASGVDSLSVKIGEQITYTIEVETDSTNLVVFPEGQTFLPLEMIESYDIDTTQEAAKVKLIKKYGLTQFDSGAYSIPRQKVLVSDQVFYTDSLQVEIRNIVVDTTKQGLYDIKPLIAVEKSSSQWWKYALIIMLILALIGALLYWFIWRKPPMTQDEKIAMLPPYDRAKLALQKLDESAYLVNNELKDYYSELTFIIRKYLDEKVYDHALESTTDELIDRLNLLKDGNQIDISSEDIKNIETILKRADLVKFAKSAPDIELAKLDRNTIDQEIDQVKEALPEPSEEEKLLDQKYKEALALKRKRKKQVVTVALIFGLCVLTYIGFGVKYGFTYVNDSIIGVESKQLLEGEWVTSDYGVPPITISTPKVLKREPSEIPETAQSQMIVTNFGFESVNAQLHIELSTSKLKDQESKQEIDLNQTAETVITEMENDGIENILVKQDKYVTPNNAEGLKTFGSATFPIQDSEDSYQGEYILLHFTDQNILQQIKITWPRDDDYANQIVDRIMTSIELVKEVIPDEKENTN